MVSGGWCPPTCVENGLVLPSPHVSPRLVLYPTLFRARAQYRNLAFLVRGKEGREGKGSVSRVRGSENGAGFCLLVRTVGGRRRLLFGALHRPRL